MKGKISASKLMIAVIVVLVVIIGAAAWINQQNNGSSGGDADGSLEVVRDGEVIRQFSYEEICSMDSASFEKEIVSGNKGNESGVYRGVPLREILAAADESILSECSSVTGTASDGFVSVYSMSEITGSDSIAVVDEKDGEPLKKRSEGGSGPLRIVAADDTYGTRSTQYLTRIEVS